MILAIPPKSVGNSTFHTAAVHLFVVVGVTCSVGGSEFEDNSTSSSISLSAFR